MTLSNKYAISKNNMADASFLLSFNAVAQGRENRKLLLEHDGGH